jgi:hypothetical protein
MTGVCRDCRDELDHCHGTVVLHAGTAAECTESCDYPEDPHPFRIDCAAVGCHCVDDDSHQLRATG